MKKIILLFVFCINLTFSCYKGGLSLNVGSEVEAQLAQVGGVFYEAMGGVDTLYQIYPDLMGNPFGTLDEFVILNPSPLSTTNTGLNYYLYYSFYQTGVGFDSLNYCYYYISNAYPTYLLSCAECYSSDNLPPFTPAYTGIQIEPIVVGTSPPSASNPDYGGEGFSAEQTEQTNFSDSSMVADGDSTIAINIISDLNDPNNYTEATTINVMIPDGSASSFIENIINTNNDSTMMAADDMVMRDASGDIIYMDNTDTSQGISSDGTMYYNTNDEVRTGDTTNTVQNRTTQYADSTTYSTYTSDRVTSGGVTTGITTDDFMDSTSSGVSNIAISHIQAGDTATNISSQSFVSANGDSSTYNISDNTIVRDSAGNDVASGSYTSMQDSSSSGVSNSNVSQTQFGDTTTTFTNKSFASGDSSVTIVSTQTKIGDSTVKALNDTTWSYVQGFNNVYTPSNFASLGSSPADFFDTIMGNTAIIKDFNGKVGWDATYTLGTDGNWYLTLYTTDIDGNGGSAGRLVSWVNNGIVYVATTYTSTGSTGIGPTSSIDSTTTVTNDSLFVNGYDSTTNSWVWSYQFGGMPPSIDSLAISDSSTISTNSPCPTDSDFQVTAAMLKEMNPKGNINIINQAVTYLNQYMSDYGIITRQRLAYFLANASVETDYFTNLIEGYNYSSLKILQKAFGNKFDSSNYAPYINCICALDKAYAGDGNSIKHNNGNEASQDGSTYLGRGLLDLTHRDSYYRFSKFYQQKYNDPTFDVESNPDLVASDLRIAVLSALWEFGVDKSKSNNPKFNALMAADNDDNDTVTHRVNGGNNNKKERGDKVKQAKKMLCIN